MSKNEVFIGEVEVDTPDEKKKKLSLKSKIIVGGMVSTVVVVSILSMYKGNNQPSYFQMVDKGTSLIPTESEDKDIWREKQQDKMKDVTDQLDKIVSILNSQVESQKETRKTIKNLSDRVDQVANDNRLMKERVDNFDQVLNSKIKEFDKKLQKKIEQVVLTKGSLKNQFSFEKGSKAEGDKKKTEDENLEIPLPTVVAEKKDPLKPFNHFKMPNPKVSPGDVPPPPANPFATIKDKKKRVVRFNTDEQETKVEEEVSSGLMVSGMSQKEANKYRQERVKAKRKLVKSPFAGHLPSGSFAKIAIISGLDAGASSDTQKNPQPVLMRIQSDAIVPSMQGKIKYKLKGCFVVGSAYGDISSERVMIKPTRLSCIDARRKFILSAPINGYITDFDNTQGLRGKVDYRDGARIAKSIMASSASSLAQIAAMGSGVSNATLSSSLTGTSNTTGSVTPTVNLPSGSQLATAAGLNAFSSSIDIIAKRYADQAKEIHPIIVLPGGRKGSIVFSRGVNLKWDRYDSIYQEQIEPKKDEIPDKFKGGLLAK